MDVPALNDKFLTIFGLTLPSYENYVGVFSRVKLDVGSLRKKVIALSEKNRKLKLSRLKFSVRKIK